MTRCTVQEPCFWPNYFALLGGPFAKIVGIHTTLSGL